MRIYLAGRYSRRLELCEYREALQALGHTVNSRWLNGDHELRSLDDDSAAEVPTAQRARFAQEDFNDLTDSELVICFTEPPQAAPSRGGRHVEMGIALGFGQKVWIVGHRENIFCWLPRVRFFQDFTEVLAWLKS